MPSPYLDPASVMLFQLHGGTVSHMQALATPSLTVHVDVASGADRLLDITFIQIAGS